MAEIYYDDWEDLNIHIVGELKRVVNYASQNILWQLKENYVRRFAYMDGDDHRMLRNISLANPRKKRFSTGSLYGYSYIRTMDFYEAWKIKRPTRVWGNATKEYKVVIEYVPESMGSNAHLLQHVGFDGRDSRNILDKILNTEGMVGAPINMRKRAYWNLFIGDLESIWDEEVNNARVDLGYE